MTVADPSTSCPICEASTARPHCRSAGCPWISCKACRRVIDPRTGGSMADHGV